MKTTCHHCSQQVDLRHDLVVLVADHDGEGTNLFSYLCPRGSRITVQDVTAQTVVRLMAHGLWPTVSRQPADRPEHPPGGPPFVSDDLLEFHLLLATDTWFDRLLALTCHPTSGGAPQAPQPKE